MTTQADSLPVTDRHGRPMFHCRDCGAPMLQSDFFDQGLRLPDGDETADDYRDAELLDYFRHGDCARAHSA